MFYNIIENFIIDFHEDMSVESIRPFDSGVAEFWNEDRSRFCIETYLNRIHNGIDILFKYY